MHYIPDRTQVHILARGWPVGRDVAGPAAHRQLVAVGERGRVAGQPPAAVVLGRVVGVGNNVLPYMRHSLCRIYK